MNSVRVYFSGKMNSNRTSFSIWMKQLPFKASLCRILRKKYIWGRQNPFQFSQIMCMKQLQTWKYFPQTMQAYTFKWDRDTEQSFSKSKSNTDLQNYLLSWKVDYFLPIDSVQIRTHPTGGLFLRLHHRPDWLLVIFSLACSILESGLKSRLCGTDIWDYRK